MVKKLAVGLLICILILSVLTFGSGYSQCSCEDEGFWSITSILECQKVSDFLIAVAYFSIPIELIYFISCSNVPFKWVLLEFIAFIVLCGMTHLLTGWTYYGPHAFRLVMSLTVLKFLTALVSCATAITLLTLIPLLLKVKVREVFLRKNVLELNQEVGMMKKKKEASWHVRMLTREIRKWLDKHTILDTTLVELSKTLDLQNCAVWMPNEKRSQMNLTHELKPCPSRNYPVSIQINDPDAREICESKGVRILRPGSALGMASSAGAVDPGSVAAIRMPLLTVSNFKGGTPELVETYYAILVLVLPTSRLWTYHELEIVEVVADQVAVALSHARILEESQLMMEKLGEQNRALQLAKKDAVMASQARDSFQRVMSQGMRRPMHSILGLLSMFQDETLQFEQRILVDSIIGTSNVLTTLINDVMDLSLKDNKIFSLEMKLFHLHSLVKEASCLAKSLFVYRGTRFVPDVEPSLPDQVIGDKRRTFQVLLHMVGYLTELTTGGGSVIFRVSTESGGEGRMGMWGTRYVNVKFEFELSVASRGGSGSSSRGLNKRGNKEVLSFSMCKKLVQMMQGNIWITQNIPGLPQRMTLLLRFQLHRYPGPTHETLSERMRSDPMFIGLRVILADDDPINRTVTKKLLEKLGCHVTAVSQGRECLATLGAGMSSVRVVLLDLHMPEMDGFEVARRIWKSRGGARVGPLIIAVTASAEENVWERCLEMGMNGLIRKPVVLQVLADELHRVLQRGQ